MLCPTPRVLTGSVFACFSTRGYTHPADLPLRHLCACELVFDVLNQTSRSSSHRVLGCGAISTSDRMLACPLLWDARIGLHTACPFAACPWLPVHPFTRVPRPWVRSGSTSVQIQLAHCSVVIVPSAHKQTRAHLSHSSALDECDQCETRPCLSWLHSHTVDLQHSKHGRSTHHTHSTHTHNTHKHVS